MTEEGQGKETRQDKRAEKLRKKKAKIQQHGKGLGKIYKAAVEKRKREE
jgi:hypothetical protein